MKILILEDNEEKRTQLLHVLDELKQELEIQIDPHEQRDPYDISQAKP